MTPTEKRKRLLERIHAGSEPIPQCGCWIWKNGARNGYGRLSVNDKSEYAHRVSYFVHVGDIPNGSMVLHKCDVRSCVNPDHLYVGTAKDNIQDCVSRGRFTPPRLRGEALASKLCERDVLAIRHLASIGYRNREISDLFGICCSYVSDIATGKRWGSVGGPITRRGTGTWNQYTHPTRAEAIEAMLFKWLEEKDDDQG